METKVVGDGTAERLAILMDVLETLDRKEVGQRIYFRSRLSPEVTITDTTQLQDILPQIEHADCHVCALGAMFLSCVRIHDNFEAKALFKPRYFSDGDYLDADVRWLISNPLGEYFDFEQLSLIEVAFEGTADVPGCGILSQKDRDRALKFSENLGFIPHKKRLEAIIQNMIANNGIFVPEMA